MPTDSSLPDELVLTDPRSVRALAHPVRLAVIDALYSGEVLTATELARRTGTTPSAMSYHLRHLASFGLVRRASSRGDGRERPWERSAKDTRIDVSRESPRAVASVTRLLVEESMRRDIEDLITAASGGHPDKSSFYSRARVIVTDDEIRAATTAMFELLDAYRDRPVDERPEGAHPVRVSVMTVSESDPDAVGDDIRAGS